MIGLLLKAGKRNILIAAALLATLTSVLDWVMGKNVSLAAVYILPVMVGAVVLRPVETAVFALVCSFLRSQFEVSASPAEVCLRYVFTAFAYFVSGFFVTMLVRNHETAVQHLAKIREEQALRREAEDQLRLLAESSPATILTMNRNGEVLAANTAASELFGLGAGEMLRGRSIGRYLPVLDEALRVDVGPEGLRTAVQCQGYRENGELFLANIWFSSYLTEEGARLAAIVVDSSEEMREREQQGLEELMLGNRIAAAAVSHEVRNFAVAMGLLCGNLRQRPELAQDADLMGLSHLIGGLQTIAVLKLESRSQEPVREISLRDVLDTLRIVIEPEWREIDGTVVWQLPADLPAVVAESRGLLQAFLNLAHNSRRAVQQSAVKELRVEVSVEPKKAVVRFRDSGPGIEAPERLFQPFQEGASGSGMGLYLSRFIIRSYGGELRFEVSDHGSCFAVELETLGLR